MPYFDKKSGKYRATKMINGKRKNKMFKSKSEAKRWEAQQTEEVWNDVPQSSGSISLLEWSVEYLDYSKQRHMPKTYAEEKVPAFNRLFEEIPHALPVTDLTVTECLRVLKKRAKEVSGNAANKDRKNLAAAWSWGAKYLDAKRESVHGCGAVPRYAATPVCAAGVRLLEGLRGCPSPRSGFPVDLTPHRGEAWRTPQIDVGGPGFRERKDSAVDP